MSNLGLGDCYKFGKFPFIIENEERRPYSKVSVKCGR